MFRGNLDFWLDPSHLRGLTMLNFLSQQKVKPIGSHDFHSAYLGMLIPLKGMTIPNVFSMGYKTLPCFMIIVMHY